MRMRFLCTIFLAWFACAAWAPPASEPPPTRMLSPAQLREDLQRLRFTIEHAHGGPYRYTPKPALDARFDSVAASLNAPMSDLDFYRLMAPLVAAIRDSHTSILGPSPVLAHYLSSNSRRVFPLDLRFTGDRVLVEADLGDAPAATPGLELLAIGGRPTAEIVARITALIPADGFITSSKLARLNRSFYYYYLTFYGEAGAYAVTLRDPATGRIVRLSLPGIPPRRLAGREAPNPGPAAQRLALPGEGMAILTLDELSDPQTGAFLEDSFRRIAESGATDLIIDIRNCPGGDDRFNNRLLSYLVDRPFRFYRGRDFRARSWEDLRYVGYTLDDFITPEQALLLPEAQRSDPLHRLTLPELLRFMLSVDEAEGVFQTAPRYRFAGRVYLLVSGNSGSSAAEIPALLHHLSLATIVGEEPSGAYQGLIAGAIPVLTLPNSQIRVRIPMIGYHNAVMPGLFEGRGAPPAFPVSQGLEDALAGVDTAMAFTRRLILARRMPAYAPVSTPPH